MSTSAYAAGLLEAKASVWRSEKYGACIAVTDTDRRIIEWLRERYGGAAYRQAEATDRTKARWRWRIRNGFDHVLADVKQELRFREREFREPAPPRPDRGVRVPGGARGTP